MGDGIWLPIAGIVLLAIIILLVARTPSEEDKRQAEAIVRGEFVPVVTSASAPTPRVAPPFSPGESWRIGGWLGMVAGFIALAFALFMKTTVETDTSGLLGGAVPSEVVNLDLLFHKGMAIAGSLTAIVVGVVCIGVGAIIGAIQDRGNFNK